MAKKEFDCEGETDKRILTKMLLDGEITEEHLQTYLEKLPDVSSCADEIAID
ncbi:MAG TPA: hypothetical protein VEF33_12325 [Syntrophales bacterium]|nr:hypothetical protein [Syntrophales bacterium]